MLPMLENSRSLQEGPKAGWAELISELGETNFARICCAHDNDCRVLSPSLTQPTRFLLYFVPSNWGSWVIEQLGGHLAATQGQPTTYNYHYNLPWWEHWHYSTEVLWISEPTCVLFFAKMKLIELTLVCHINAARTEGRMCPVELVWFVS